MDTLRHYLDFLWAMTEKEIKARYKRASFGFLWMILNPILQMAIVGFIFSFFVNIPDYFLFLFAGLLLWTFFSLSVSKATPSIVYDRALLQKAKFPIEAIPTSIVLANFLHLLISVVLFLGYLFLVGIVPHFLLLVISLLWLLIFTVFFSLLTASLNVFYRDVNFFVQSALILWFYATPILYSVTLLPQNFRFIFALNPLTTIFELFRFSVLKQGFIDYQIVAINLLVTSLVAIVGILVYARKHRFFVDWL